MNTFMKLLKNQKDFDCWKKRNIYDGDTADQPREFPCYVAKDVQSWHNEEVKAVYLYKADMRKMMDKIDGKIE